MFEVRPLTDQTWTDLEELFSQRGGSIVRGCWCIYYRKVGPVGISPREDYRRLERSRVMKAVDDTPVWSIVCTYVAKAHRGKGYQHKLLARAIDYARDQGVGMLESYPVDKPERSHDDFMFFGSHSLYARAGFNEVVRRSPTRLVMRRGLRARRKP